MKKRKRERRIQGSSSKRYLLLEPGECDMSRRASVCEIEAMISDSVNDAFIAGCRDLIEQHRADDVLVEFCSSRKAWESLLGVAGYQLVRDGEVVTAVTCRMD